MRLVSMTLALVLCCGLAGCGSDKKPPLGGTQATSTANPIVSAANPKK
ncbi:MAG: hypothetical protein JNJ77_10385 [Planctomycetia bacterium]|nr:hypothetical protein [Planctomycetia bacterium]